MASPSVGSAARSQTPAQLRGGLVLTDDPDDRGLAAQGDDVLRDVPGPAEPVVVTGEPNDRHGRLRRDPIDVPDEEMVEHEVAQNRDVPACEARGQSREAGH